jgi:hypothetical protein
MHDGPLADLFRATDAAKPAEPPREEPGEHTQMMEPPAAPPAPPVQAAPAPTPAAPHIQPVPDPVDAPAAEAARPAAAFARGDIKGSPVARDVSSHAYLAVIRVELEALKVEDFVRILTEPDASLCTQYGALLSTEGVTLKFDASGVRRIAEVAFDVNQRTENIGARRLHTVMERLLEAISFDASDRFGTELVIDGAYVDSSLGKLAQDEDLARYIL